MLEEDKIPTEISDYLDYLKYQKNYSDYNYKL